MIHLDDTYEGAGEHDGFVITVALAGWRVLPVGRRKSLPNGCHEGGLVFVKQGWGTWIIVEFNDGQGNVRVGSVRISRSGGTGGGGNVEIALCGVPGNAHGEVCDRSADRVSGFDRF